MSDSANPGTWCNTCGQYHGGLDACPDLCEECEENLAEYGKRICQACAKDRAAESREREEWEQ